MQRTWTELNIAIDCASKFDVWILMGEVGVGGKNGWILMGEVGWCSKNYGSTSLIPQKTALVVLLGPSGDGQNTVQLFNNPFGEVVTSNKSSTNIVASVAINFWRCE